MSALYDKGRESFLKGEISWNTDNIKAVLVDTDAYIVNLATHQFITDVTGITATSPNLSSKTTTTGIANAASALFTAVTGNVSEALVLYQDSGTAATSRLIAYIDSASGLPVTPNGGDIQITWDTGTNKIFKL